MHQRLEVTFGVFNNRDQIQEEERTQCEKRQAKAQAKQVTVAVSHAWQPQGNPKGTRSFNHQSRGKTNKRECFKYKSTGHWACKCQERPQAMPSLQRDRSLEMGVPSVLKGKGGSCSRWPCWTTEVVPGILAAPPCPLMSCLSLSRSPRWSLMWQVRRSIF